MNVAILENDHRTVKILEDLLKKISATIKVVCKIESIEKSLLWFETNPNPDLILLNTSLSDGSSFEIFKSKVILSPLIFVSSTNEFAIQSYKLNCVDYLLKPIKKEEFQFAFNKFNFIFNNSETLNSSLNNSNISIKKIYKSRFLIKYGDTILFKNIEEIAYFYADEKVVYLVCHNGRKFIIDYNLEAIEKQLNPLIFYRINRKLMVALSSIQKIKSLFNNRLQVFLKPGFEKDVFISKERSSAFKCWLDI